MEQDFESLIRVYAERHLIPKDSEKCYSSLLTTHWPDVARKIVTKCKALKRNVEVTKFLEQHKNLVAKGNLKSSLFNFNYS